MKKLLIGSATCILLGVLLIGLGYAGGGIQAIQEKTKPVKVTESFDDVKSINLNLSAGKEVIIKTGDVSKATVGYYKDKSFTPTLNNRVSGNQLTISEKYKDITVTGLVAVVGYLLNRDSFDQALTITLPKGSQLNELNGGGLNSNIENLSIKHLIWSGSLNLDKVTVDKGDLSGTLTATNSHLTQLSGSYNFDLKNSSLENSQIDALNYDGYFTSENSQLKSLSLNLSPYSQVEMTNSSLEDSHISIDKDDYIGEEISESNFIASDLTLKGQNSISGSGMNLDLNLIQAKTLALDIKTNDGDITLSSTFDKNKILTDEMTDASSFTQTQASPAASLTITLKKGDINLK